MSKKNKKIKLIDKTSRTFLWISFILMMLSTVVLYFYVKDLLQNEIEEELFSTRARIESALTTNKQSYSLPPVIEIKSVSSLGKQVLKDTIIYDPSQNEMEKFRELTSYKKINAAIYRITVRNLVVESGDILIAIVLSYLIIILLVFIFLFYFSKAKNERLWQPFFTNLEQMKRFSLPSTSPMELMDSEILEFSELNKEIDTLTNKVRTDYLNLKQFTEDVSHEIQTPLAIIQAKIENIINGDDLDQIQYEQLTSIQKDIQRLTQMNKRLTLLTKIENNQFGRVEKVAITQYMENTIQNFHEITTAKMQYNRKNAIWVDMDSYLAEILCNNLLSNAIKHGSNNGVIQVAAVGNVLSVANVGTKALAHPEKLYSRFYRESQGVKSTGLGLAILKKICDLYGFDILYEFKGRQHVFILDFKPQK